MPWIRNRKGQMVASRRTQHRGKKYRLVLKDKIKTAGDVKKVVRDAQPASVFIRNTVTTVSNVPTVMQRLSNITFSNSNDTTYARKSTNIRAGHVSLRCRLQVADRPGNLIRFMVVRLKDSSVNPTAFDPQTMFQWNDGNGSQPDNMYSDVNLRIAEPKYDKVFNLQASTETLPATRMQDIYFDVNVPFKETWKYKMTSNGAQEFTRNLKDYFIVCFSDSSLATHPAITLTSFTWFKNISNNA